ncbi:MAG: isochorismate synthase, partial [Microcystaceae cyanobacterium]
NTHFNLIQSLNNLRQLHPNCYVFSNSNGKGQNFIGASPERLISIHQQQLMTDALAGSAPRGKTPGEDANNASRLLNSDKERHEHSSVIDFITQRLSQLGLLPQVLAPRLRQLSNIQHLWTPISASVPTDVHPLRIVAQLHPTPAVAGTSQEVACREIRRYESFERGLYAAPLGWIDLEGNCEFIVGIRSALIDGDRARLYAGAGIVAGSDPDKELAEIQLKLQALLKALV